MTAIDRYYYIEFHRVRNAIVTETMVERTEQYSNQLRDVSGVYNIYRIVLPLVLLVTSLSPGSTLLGAYDSSLFVEICIIYTIFGVIVTFFGTSGSRLATNVQVLSGALIIDILALTLIIFSSGGVVSGLGLLLIVTMAAGSILIRGRISTFLAAVATLSIIYCELYLALVIEDRPNQFVQTGILGIILFATSLYIQTVTVRSYKTAQLADEQAKSIIDLEKLNNEIIQRMRTGIVVVSSDHEIISANSSAQKILTPLGESHLNPESTLTLPVAISDQIKLWKINAKREPQPFSLPGSSRQIQLSFAFLRPDPNSDILIFLEDNRQIVQRVRQSKLASLGRLTASIAHEVRNPLGAISHASQLLHESESINEDDRRMVEIVLNHCNRVNLIIEDVLDASRHDDTTAKKLHLKEWLGSFIANYRATHELCDEVECEINPDDIMINVIEGQLEQVLNNLFDNGLRYSHKNTGKATLKIIAGIDTKNSDEQPFLHIIDDGEGISEKAESQLFEPFHTTESSGTGLGLYISKELCEANQSQLAYSRTADGKSCFTIYFSNPDRVMN